MVLEIERVACDPLKVKVTAVELLLAYKPCAALVAITEHCVDSLAVSVASISEHSPLGVDSAYVTTPVPEPPLEVRLTTVLMLLVRVLFVIVRPA